MPVTCCKKENMFSEIQQENGRRYFLRFFCGFLGKRRRKNDT